MEGPPTSERCRYGCLGSICCGVRAVGPMQGPEMRRCIGDDPLLHKHNQTYTSAFVRCTIYDQTNCSMQIQDWSYIITLHMHVNGAKLFI